MLRRLPSFFASSRDTTAKQDDSDARPPPPPYSPSSNPPFLLTETRTTRTQVITTTTETTTETTRHVLPAGGEYRLNSPLPSPKLGLGTTLGTGLSDFLSLDKALPPTPPRTASSPSQSPRTSTSSRRSSTVPHTPSISQLGRASLAVCLPPVGGPDVLTQFTPNTGASVSFPVLPPADQGGSHLLRRPKSAHRIERQAPSSPAGDNFRRRSRGLSLNAASWLTFGAPVDVKGKEREDAKENGAGSGVPATSPSIARSKSLSRKASFWSRKKNSTSALLDAPRVSESAPRRQAPTLPFLSIAGRAPATTSPSWQDPGRPSLGRRHSDNPATPVRSEFTSPVVASPHGNSADNIITTSPQRADLSLPHDSNAEPIHPSPSPRPRSQTNAPLLHRLSSALFQFSEPASSHASPKQSMSSCASPVVVMRDIPKPDEDTESPSLYVSRLRSVVSKAEIALVLASSSEPFYVEALNCFFRRFDFHDEPLDIALRKLLMEVGLPRETQQIDRVMEAFSSRYSECNPSLFADKDHGYVLAFSLIMLHTDAFNPSNKSKMTKADYVKNTSLAGLPPEVLSCYYDNIVFAPFIFIEDALDINGQVGLTPDVASAAKQTRSPSSPYNGGVLGKTKIDPYYLITHNLLESMQTTVEQCVPLDEPYTWNPVGDRVWSENELQAAFSNAGVIEVQSPNSQAPATPFVNGAPLSAGMSPSQPQPPASTTIRVSKVGMVNRKDDIGLRGKRNAFRKWRSWSALLTGSQLLFYRDPSLADDVLRVLNSDMGEGGPTISTTRASLVKPDEILSVKDAIAVYDRTYTKREHTIRFVLPNGRQILLQASSTDDMDEWLTKINYASAFKSAGVRIRPLGMTHDEIHMTGVAAATALLHDAQHASSLSASTRKRWDMHQSRELMGMLSADSFNSRPSTSQRRLTIAPCDDFDVDSISFIDTAASQQFEATFKKVKADLAQESGSHTFESPPVTPMTASSTASSRHPARAGIVRRKIDEIQIKLAATQSELGNDLRIVRNIAILKPFQRATRARLLQPVQSVARKVMSLRLEVARLNCHLSVLRRDLDSEHRCLDEMQNAALEAAKQSLDRETRQIPRMTISRHDSFDQATEIRSPKSFTRSWSNSSMAESFQSALEYPTDDVEVEATSPSLSPSHLLDSPNLLLSYSSTPYPTSNDSTVSVLQMSTSYSSSTGGMGKNMASNDEPTEEAEAWNKTRCAQRVSLIRVPSTLSFSHPPDSRN